MYSPSLVFVIEYFDKKSSVALGLASAGGSVGAFVVPHLMLFLFHHYGFSGGLLVLGALTFNCCVSGALYRPLRRPMFEMLVVQRDATSGSASVTDGGQTTEGQRSSVDRCGQVSQSCEHTDRPPGAIVCVRVRPYLISTQAYVVEFPSFPAKCLHNFYNLKGGCQLVFPELAEQ